MGFLDVKKEDIEALKPCIFKQNELVKFVCLDHMENAQTGDLTLRTQVLTGDHAGKTYNLYISGKDHEVAKKVKLQFVLTFWTEEELESGQANLARLINREFEATAGQAREYRGRTFQNFANFKDLGQHAEAAGTDGFDSTNVPF